MKTEYRFLTRVQPVLKDKIDEFNCYFTTALADVSTMFNLCET